ncbi:glycosyltransferase [Intrasporangium chromatireducens]|nr:glycosyltransferase [Intrasporangium chromatireducens]
MQFPPARGSGVYRIRAWANHLAARGHDVTVLAASRQYWHDLSGDLDEELAARTHPRVSVVEMDLPREHLVQDVARMSFVHANFPRAYLLAHQALQRKVFPEPYAPMLPTFVLQGLKVHRLKPVDLILSTGNPYAQYGAAMILGRLIRRPYVVDYHDPWTLDLWQEEDAFPPGHLAHRWERRIIDGAARIITVNQPLVDWYQARYPEAAGRVRLVENGLAPDTVTEPPFSPVGDRPLRVGFLGTIRNDLPLAEFLDGWELAQQSPELAGASMNFYGYLGFFRQHANGILQRLTRSEDQRVKWHGPVSQTKVSEVLGSLDVMAMLLTSSRYVTAGKGFDYMASGRPVVGVHDPRNDTTTLFKNYPLFFGAREVTAEAIASALVEGARAARAETVAEFRACRAEALKHTWDAAIAPVADEFEELMR